MFLAEELRNIQFKGFESLRWDKIFMRLQIEGECGCMKGLRPFIAAFAGLFLSPFLRNEKTNFEIKQYVGNKILCMQDNPDRQSNIRLFNSVCGLAKTDKLLGISITRRSANNLFDGFKLCFLYIPSWWKSLLNTRLSIYWKAIIINRLIYLWHFQKETQALDIDKYNLLVTYYDSALDQGFLTEIFKAHHKTTATLQHGIFTAWRENALVNSGVEFRSFHSDYFLAWNQFTIDEALKVGLDTSKFLKTGIIEYADSTCPCWINPANGTFGVVIGHPMFEEENLKLIEAANLLAKSIKKSFYLKLHPNYRSDYFDTYVDKHYYLGNIEKGIPIIDYANMVEFSFVGSSSVFVQLIYVSHDVIRYSDLGVKDKFRDIKIGKIFNNPSDIVEVYNANKGKDYTADLFDYLCSVKDVASAYRNFFELYS